MKKSVPSFHYPIVVGIPAIKMSAFLFLLLSSWSATTTGFLISPPTQISSLSSSCCDSNHHRLPLTTTTLAARTTDNKNNDEETETRKPTTKREITGSVELESCWDDAFNEAASLSAKGDTQIIGSPDHLGFVHPVVRVLHDRKRKLAESTTGAKSDDGDKKIALVIEGGGMRGCVTAGMVCAIDYLGLRDCVDIVYGSSAGSIIGAYFVTGQLPWFGPELYYDQLTTANKSFIDTNRMLRALGLGALNPKLLKDVLLRRNAGKPVLSLEFLLEETLQRTKPLNWESFVERQKSDVHTQPLKIVAAGLKREETLVMTYEDKHFESLEELAMCMHASSLLPGLAGPMVNILTNHNDDNNKKPKFVFRNNLKDSDYEPLADALVYAPIPYEVAVKEGATHMIVLRSKPDGGDVIGKGGSLVEKLITKRFFLRKNKLPRIYDRLKKQLHKKLYAKSVLELNEAAREGSDGALSSSSSPLPPTLTVAIPGHIAEVPRLEVGREAIFEGVRDGFARAYDTLVEDPSERGKGYEVAKKYFPDEILDYEPHEMLSLQKEQGSSHQKSAFETYLETSGVWPKAWEGLEEPPMGCSADRITATRTNSSSSKETTGAVPQ